MSAFEQTPEAKLAYDARWQRIMDCVALKQPDRSLEIIKDIPPGKCIYWFERTNMVKAFEVLGDVVALRGNLSPSLMVTGTAAEVDVAVKHLVDNVWNKGGSLILDTAFGIPDETPIQNVRAMFDAARKYAG
jgi:uroporphyrinogen-III decarboxylase